MNSQHSGPMYNQVRGTVMATKFAPTYATLVLAYLEEKLYSQVEIKFDKEFADYIKDNWKRFLDDCIFDKRRRKFENVSFNIK